MSNVIAWTAFALGALLCLFNFYLSFLRYPLHRLRGLPEKSFHYASGIQFWVRFLLAHHY